LALEKMNGSAAAASPGLLDKKAAKQRYKEERRKIKEKEKEMKEQKKKEAKELKRRGKGFVGASISGPTNFSHDTHVGWDMDHGFEVPRAICWRSSSPSRYARVALSLCTCAGQMLRPIRWGGGR
jgi:hypothetical protein